MSDPRDDPRMRLREWNDVWVERAGLSEEGEDAVDEKVIEIMELLCADMGHDVTPDNCGRPEHDYCGWCQTTVPNGWKGRKQVADSE